MITTQDLQEAVAECLGERNPTSQTCIKLAAYYTIMDHMGMEPPQYSFQAAPSSPPQRGGGTVRYEGETEFAKAIDGLDGSTVWPVMDELMTAVQAMNPRLYAGVMRRLTNV